MNTICRRLFVPVPLCCALLVAVLLPGCKSVEVPKVPGVTPYRMVIQQGNFISQEMVDQLKPGMTKEQVRFVLGTPLVTDIFHADRWDYVFFREQANGKREQRNLSVIFEKDRLARVLGDLMPSEGSAVRSTGFDPQQKSEPKPAAKPAADAPKASTETPPPAADAAKPAAELAKPAAPAPKPAAESWEPTKQNWGAAPEPEKKPNPAPVSKEEERKPAEEPKERGFFGRMLEKIGL